MALLTTSALAQQPDVVLTDARMLAAFAQARAMAADPQGRLYVADAGADVVYQLTPDGRLLARLGGSGAQEGAFFEPSDIDPTNGLILVVADAGNGRIQRFSSRFVPLETLPVTRARAGERRASGQAFYQLGKESNRSPSTGEPVAVITSAANETFVVDAAQGLVMKWDARRQLERTIGDYDAGEGTLEDPVALALDATSLYVADRGLGAVMVYDHFGDYVRTVGHGQLEDIRAVVTAGNRIWAVGSQTIWAFEKPGRLLWRASVSLGEPLVDLHPTEHGLYLLTPTRLLWTEMAARGLE